MWLLAQESTGTGPVEWVQYGVLGLVVLALLTGWLWAKPAVDRLLADNERLRQQRDACDDELLAEVKALRADLERMRGDR